MSEFNSSPLEQKTLLLVAQGCIGTRHVPAQYSTLMEKPAPSPSLSQLASFCVRFGAKSSSLNFLLGCQPPLRFLPGWCRGCVCYAFKTFALVVMESLAGKGGLYPQQE